MSFLSEVLPSAWQSRKISAPRGGGPEFHSTSASPPPLWPLTTDFISSRPLPKKWDNRTTRLIDYRMAMSLFQGLYCIVAYAFSYFVFVSKTAFVSLKLKHSYSCQLKDFNWLQSFLLLREKLKVITELNMICIFRERRKVLIRSAIKMKYPFPSK